MRYMLQTSSDGTSSTTLRTGGAVQVQTSGAGPNFTLALLVLVGFCALSGVAWIFVKLIRICRPRRPQLRIPSATYSGGSSTHGHHLQHRSFASLSGPFISDLERADIADSSTAVERTDSMVMRASAWARAILSGEHPLPTTLPTPPPLSSSNQSRDTISIPVKQAVVIVQPDGEASLGISEVKQKDVMVQVDEEDLIRESNSCNSTRPRGINSISTAPQRRQQRRNVVDEASQCPGQASRENITSQLGRASASDFEDLNNLIRGGGGGNNNNNTIAAMERVDIGEDRLNITVSASPEIENSSSSLPIEEQGQGQDQQRDDRHRHRRRRRKRRKGTCEASCQTEESSLI